MKSKELKIALVHDYIKEFGGAERVLETLHEMYPAAPVYTLVYYPQFLGPHKERFKTWHIVSTFLQYVPFGYKFISVFRLIAPLVFKGFDFKEFDVIIVSATGAYNPNIFDKNEALQICYCHTPPRYLYGYATAREWKKNVVLRVLGEIANHFLRMVDYSSSRNVDIFIANSQNVAARIKKFYRRDSLVVYPPVVQNKELKKENREKKQNSSHISYYFSGGRLARAKHIDVIIKAFKELDLPLKIFGKGFAGYEKELFSIKDANVAFLGEISDEEKLELMKHAKAFIFAGEDEDFGIVPVEAMSVGTPVIAYKSGGVLESVIEGKTGIFFNELTVKSVISAIKKFEKMKFNPETCRKQAEKFSKEKFVKGIEAIVAGSPFLAQNA